jgi:hypothetical protein
VTADAPGHPSTLPDVDELAVALVDAADAHHELEEHALAGVRDEQWAAFYAAFVLGRLGPFTTPSRLAGLLSEVDAPEGWATEAARHVIQAATPPD